MYPTAATGTSALKRRAAQRTQVRQRAFAFSFSLPAVGEEEDCVDWDVTMPSPFAEELEFTDLPGAVFVPARYCLYTVVETPGMDFLRREALRLLYDFLPRSKISRRRGRSMAATS